LYFDIDGVLLDYYERPKPALIGGVFERALQDAGFDWFVCVSGWAAMASAPAQWFLDRLVLCTDPDRRGWSIDTGGECVLRG